MSDSTEKPNPPAGPPTTAGRPEVTEDAGFQALSDALGSSFVIVKFIMVILVVVFLGSGFFTVSSQERAVVLRFGKPVGVGEAQLLQPGAHFAFPYPIDEVVRIPFTTFQTVSSTMGWYATSLEAEVSGNEMGLQQLNPATDGYTLTSDGNLLHVRATMRYRIINPLNYALNFVAASNLVENALNNALFYASEYFTIDDVRTNKLAFQEKITARVEALVQEQGLGIKVEQVDPVTKVPLYLNSFFEQVGQAEQQRAETNQVARTFATTLAARTQGDTNAVINLGLSEKNRLISEFAAELNAFTNQLASFRKNPSFWLERSRMETARSIFTNTNVKKWYVPDQVDEIRMDVSRPPEAARMRTPPGQPQ